VMTSRWLTAAAQVACTAFQDGVEPMIVDAGGKYSEDNTGGEEGGGQEEEKCKALVGVKTGVEDLVEKQITCIGLQ
jgi:hypothetical protein